MDVSFHKGRVELPIGYEETYTEDKVSELDDVKRENLQLKSSVGLVRCRLFLCSGASIDNCIDGLDIRKNRYQLLLHSLEMMHEEIERINRIVKELKEFGFSGNFAENIPKDYISEEGIEKTAANADGFYQVLSLLQYILSSTKGVMKLLREFSEFPAPY
ncbi:MAG: hypothetical protein V3U58_04505 [Thermodesulfobacteriota bacterium]